MEEKHEIEQKNYCLYYGNCEDEIYADGINEAWYVLNKNSECYHISHETDTIKYYFASSVEGSTYTWTTDVSTSVAQEIKNAYAESMKNGIMYISTHMMIMVF